MRNQDDVSGAGARQRGVLLVAALGACGLACGGEVLDCSSGPVGAWGGLSVETLPTAGDVRWVMGDLDFDAYCRFTGRTVEAPPDTDTEGRFGVEDDRISIVFDEPSGFDDLHGVFTDDRIVLEHPLGGAFTFAPKEQLFLDFDPTVDAWSVGVTEVASVPASANWVTFSTSGTWATCSGCTDLDGGGTDAYGGSEICGADCPVATAPRGALVISVEGGPAYAANAEGRGAFVPGRAGPIVLRMNEPEYELGDNRGDMTVSIRIWELDEAAGE